MAEKRKRGFVYVPPEKRIKALFELYKDEQGITYADLAERTGQTEGAVAMQFSRCRWTLDRIRLYGKALNIPAEAITREIMY